ncbi:MAG: Holliday junction resolvase RuvX [Pseudoflavonifractor sp.]|nr:Holliday junction resolvase RuvX [Alloprevotella sp.]MCM1116880.1 Holliday junction resolvase RuvX [Pseudoflavonifractor sp.]
MGRLLAIDYGKRRCGIAVTDPSRIVATALATIDTPSLIAFVKDYVSREMVDAIIVGLPTQLNGLPSDSMRYIRPGIGALRKALSPSIDIIFFDERFTSSLAHRSMIDSGMTRKQRQDKSLADRMAATIILNDFLSSREYLSLQNSITRQ